MTYIFLSLRRHVHIHARSFQVGATEGAATAAVRFEGSNSCHLLTAAHVYVTLQPYRLPIQLPGFPQHDDSEESTYSSTSKRVQAFLHAGTVLSTPQASLP
jgi:hypothetical protein